MQNKLLDGDLVKGIRPAMQVTQLFSLQKKENITFLYLMSRKLVVTKKVSHLAPAVTGLK